MKAVHLNACFSQALNGTGTWTRAVRAACPEWNSVEARFDPTIHTARSVYRKMLYERTFALAHRHATRVHPYAACAVDQDAYVVVLDRIGESTLDVVQRRWLSQTYDMARGVATLSTRQSEELSGWLGRRVQRLSPFPDKEFFRPVARHVLARKRISAMYWGGCHPRKRIAETLQALEKSNIDVIVVGEVPPGCDHLCRSVGAASTSELVNLIDGCDVALYPSADEGFGLPVFEALLRDRPVVCQRLPSYGDFISREEVSGLIFIDDSDLAWMPEAVTQAVSDYRPGSAIASLAVSDYDACVRTLRTELHNWVTDASDGTMS